MWNNTHSFNPLFIYFENHPVWFLKWLNIIRKWLWLHKRIMNILQRRYFGYFFSTNITAWCAYIILWKLRYNSLILLSLLLWSLMFLPIIKQEKRFWWGIFFSSLLNNYFFVSSDSSFSSQFFFFLHLKIFI